jgi:hypothetical protein
LPVPDAIKRAVVLLTLPSLLVVSAVLLALEMTQADDVPAAQGTLIGQASSQAAGAAISSVPATRPTSPTPAPEVASPEEEPAAAEAREPQGEKKKKITKKKKPPKPLPKVEGTVTIAAVGDIVMGTPTYGFPPEQGRTFFSGVERFLEGDLVLGNLEGTLSTGGVPRCRPADNEEEESSGPQTCFTFQTPPSYARWLKRAGFTTLNLANNHAYDFGPSALQQTRAALVARELRHAGAPGQITLHRRGKVRIAVVGFSTYGWSADMRDIEAAKALVKDATKRAHIVVVTMHAGAEGAQHQHVRPGVESFLGENRGDSMRFARAVINAGADLVVGHGPHVLRGMEWHRGRLIAYSLGNFAAYNTFNLSGPRQYSGVLKATLNTDGSWVRGKLVATRLEGKGIPVRDPAEQAHKLVRKLSRADFPNKAVRIDPRGRLLQPKE